jgi:hypothetical protein
LHARPLHEQAQRFVPGVPEDDDTLPFYPADDPRLALSDDDRIIPRPSPIARGMSRWFYFPDGTLRYLPGPPDTWKGERRPRRY